MQQKGSTLQHDTCTLLARACLVRMFGSSGARVPLPYVRGMADYFAIRLPGQGW